MSATSLQYRPILARVALASGVASQVILPPGAREVVVVCTDQATPPAAVAFYVSFTGSDGSALDTAAATWWPAAPWAGILAEYPYHGDRNELASIFIQGVPAASGYAWITVR